MKQWKRDGSHGPNSWHLEGFRSRPLVVYRFTALTKAAVSPARTPSSIYQQLKSKELHCASSAKDLRIDWEGNGDGKLKRFIHVSAWGQSLTSLRSWIKEGCVEGMWNKSGSVGVSVSSCRKKEKQNSGS